MVTLMNFWNNRNVGDSNLPDHYSTNNVSVVIAWLAYKLRITPNQLSVMSGVIASAAFGLALFLPAADLTSSLLWLFGFAQMAYIFDCADGQLARTTNQESEFGAFLDTGIDVAGSFLAFGSVFVLTYRHFAALSDFDNANRILFVGFVFLLARTARFLVWQKFVDTYIIRESAIRKPPGPAHHLLVGLINHQTSLAVILVFLFSPNLALLLFGAQATLLMAAYVRYFYRAHRVERSKCNPPTSPPNDPSAKQ